MGIFLPSLPESLFNLSRSFQTSFLWSSVLSSRSIMSPLFIIYMAFIDALYGVLGPMSQLGLALNSFVISSLLRTMTVFQSIMN